MKKISVPATSANIGSGFDSLGLAVSLYNHIWMEEADGVHIRSKDSTPVPTTEDNLIYSSAKYFYDLFGKPFHGLSIVQENNIPMTRGLGSSSACIVGGIVGANALLGNIATQDELVDIAAELEGHPDNSTPAILGGIVTAVLDNKKVYHIKQNVTEDLNFVTIIPNFELKTSTARGALPEMVSHKDAVYNLSRAALLSASLLEGKYENIKVAVDDKLHQPYRLKFIKGADEVFSSAYDFGAYGCYISGAGSTLMAIVDAKNIDFYDKLKKKLGDMGLGEWQLHLLKADNVGTTVSDEQI
ncbi:MAG: homoserine kinase [Oscillospiraceae bacterium]|nr:homoserine kinase [Oscillospiraceae bacterium]